MAREWHSASGYGPHEQFWSQAATNYLYCTQDRGWEGSPQEKQCMWLVMQYESKFIKNTLSICQSSVHPAIDAMLSWMQNYLMEAEWCI